MTSCSQANNGVFVSPVVRRLSTEFAMTDLGSLHFFLGVEVVREKFAGKDHDVRFLSTKDQIADVFTKALPSARFQFLRDKLRVQEPH